MKTQVALAQYTLRNISIKPLGVGLYKVELELAFNTVLGLHEYTFNSYNLFPTSYTVSDKDKYIQDYFGIINVAELIKNPNQHLWWKTLRTGLKGRFYN